MTGPARRLRLVDVGALDHAPTVLAAAVPGAARAVVCHWCMESAGWCSSTGGPNECAGAADEQAALDDTDTAPLVLFPLLIWSVRSAYH